MSTPITPEWLLARDFRTGYTDGGEGIHDYQKELPFDEVLTVSLQEGHPAQYVVGWGPHRGIATTERLSALWFALTGTHLEQADGDDALVALDAWEEQRFDAVANMTHVLPVLREAMHVMAEHERQKAAQTEAVLAAKNERRFANSLEETRSCPTCHRDTRHHSLVYQNGLIFYTQCMQCENDWWWPDGPNPLARGSLVTQVAE